MILGLRSSRGTKNTVGCLRGVSFFAGGGGGVATGGFETARLVTGEIGVGRDGKTGSAGVGFGEGEETELKSDFRLGSSGC